MEDVNDLIRQINYPSYENGFILETKKYRLPQYYELAKFLQIEKGLKTVGKYNWIYKDTHYVSLGDEMLTKMIIDLTDRNALPSWIANFTKIAKYDCQIDSSEFSPPPNHLNVLNGVIDVKNKDLLPHSDAFYFKYVIPIEYNSDAKCPRFMEFLDFVFQGDQELIDITAEIYGYCLLGGDPFLHKAFVLLGDGRNGKSTWLHVLRKLLGENNCSSVSVGLLNKPFSAVRLDGKLANITGELPTGKLDSEIFKTAIGGEYISASHKGKDEYELKVESRFVFACNDMPKFGDTTTGMWEKLYMIPFNRYITPEERDIGIFKRLEGELSGILNFSLDGLQRLLKRKRLNNPTAVNNLLKDYREESDSVYEFYKENIIIDKEFSTQRLTLKDLRASYLAFCRKNDINYPVSSKQLSKRMRRIIKEESCGESMYVKYERGISGFYFTAMHIRK